MEYKASHFNLKVRDDAGAALWFNSATGRTLALSPEDLRCIDGWLEVPAALDADLGSLEVPAALDADLESPTAEPVGRSPRASHLARTLVDQGFFVPRDRQEVKEMLERLALERLESSHLSLTLALTSDCDLACPYCIVTTTRGQGPMSGAVREALLRWWERQLVGRRTCAIDWIGGEPLLYPETILELGEALLERARFAGVEVRSHGIYTNGTHLTPEVARALHALGVTQVQVTLDGGAEAHERCRPAVDGSSSFERILANLKAAAPVLDVTVRMNLSSRNRDDYPALLERLAAEGLEERVHVYPARVFEPSSARPDGAEPCGTWNHCTLSPDAFGKVANAFQVEAMDRGFQPEALPKPARGGYCGAYTRSYFVVGSDGTLYRCPALVGQRERGAVGSVFDFVRTDRMAQTQAWYDTLGPTERKGCFGCKVLPLCLGGCPEESRTSGRLEDECSPWRFKIKGRLVIEHEWRKATEEET